MTSTSSASLFMSDYMNNYHSDSNDDLVQSHFRTQQHEIISGSWADMTIRHKEKDNHVAKSAPSELVNLVTSQGEFLVWTLKTEEFFNN